MDYDDLTSLVHSLLPKEDFILIAESFSGPIAVKIASLRPPRLRAIVLVASFITNPVKPFSALAKIAVQMPRPPMFPQWLIRKIFFTSDAPASLVRQFTSIIKSIPHCLLRHRLLCILNSDVSKDFTNCQLPILYLQGERDRLISKSIPDLMRKLQPSMSIDQLDTGHLVLQSAPVSAFRLINNFIDSRGSRFFQ